MLAMTARGTEVSVHFIMDCSPNEGGWFCEVYKYDRYGDLEPSICDDFCIHPDDCPNGCFDSCGGPSEEAEQFASNHIEMIRSY